MPTAPEARVSARMAAEELLSRRGPMRATDIIAEVLSAPGVKLDGKTPAATIQAMLSVSDKKGGPFERVEKGVYKLRGRDA